MRVRLLTAPGTCHLASVLTHGAGVVFD